MAGIVEARRNTPLEAGESVLDALPFILRD
jgi:hypothetical protein